MPRRARLALAGIPWHIIQRGNNRAVCFHAEEDYQFYLHYLKTFAERFGCVVHAYVLMTNHVHLLLTPRAESSAGLMMKHLGQHYVQYINRSYRRSGTLWEGRFRSCLTQTEDYVLACYRYIELNPVRVGMVTKPQDYRWSSYHANGLGKPNAILSPHPEYTRLGSTDSDRRQAYRALFRAHVDESRKSAARPTAIARWAANDSRSRSKWRSDGAQCAVRRAGHGRRCRSTTGSSPCCEQWRPLFPVRFRVRRASRTAAVNDWRLSAWSF